MIAWSAVTIQVRFFICVHPRPSAVEQSYAGFRAALSEYQIPPFPPHTCADVLVPFRTTSIIGRLTPGGIGSLPTKATAPTKIVKRTAMKTPNFLARLMLFQVIVLATNATGAANNSIERSWTNPGNNEVQFRRRTVCRSMGRCLANPSKSASVVRIRIRWRTATAQINRSVEVPWTPLLRQRL